MRISEIQDRGITRLRKLLDRSKSDESREALQRIIKRLERSRNDILVDLDIPVEFNRGSLGRGSGGY